jgi:hypothetical protein
MDCRVAAARSRRARLSGGPRVSQLRRSLVRSGTTVIERSSSEPKQAVPWQEATVVAIGPETSTAKTIRLRLPRIRAHVAGQYYAVRLTAPDGYSASRLYSVASAPGGSSEIEITVERLPDGEVTRFLTAELRPGDELEVRGPIGGWFVWPGDIPALVVGGGSGVVPLVPCCGLPDETAPRIWSAWSSRSAVPKSSTTPTSCPARRRPPSTRVRRQRLADTHQLSLTPTKTRVPRCGLTQHSLEQRHRDH